ncbi:MAG: HEPN domain-containing protein [Planctomycetales bacterium]|nr:HEPN domain-containing protein [Planctomycetales bacterium]
MAKLNGPKLKQLSTVRRREAAALIRQKHYDGAYYLLGYSVECALKACIAKQTKKLDFPDKQFVQSAYTHNLEKLLGLSGLEQKFKADFSKNKVLEVNWATVKDWSEASRYEVGITSKQARDMYSACTSRKNGVLTWIRDKW